MSEPVVSVRGVSKKFCQSLKRSLFYGAADALRSMGGVRFSTDTLRRGEFWALDDVSFSVESGEKLGFLGTNGSGKSTLLRLISGIFPPDRGTIVVRGSVGALIAVGVGFHPHLTGRENVFLNGSILGMTRAELTSKLDEIIEFAEIGEFIDAPVSTYSSGMAMRLGFSIAIHRQPEIMLVDEILAVGDLAFQLRCQKRLAEYRQSGGTFIIVSHNMQLIRNTCDRVLWLDKGRIVDEGNVYEVCDRYEQELLRRSRDDHRLQERRRVMNYDASVRLSSVTFVDASGAPVERTAAGEALHVRVGFKTDRRVDRPIFTLALSNAAGTVIFETYSNREQVDVPALQGEGSFTVSFAPLPLKPDVYFLSVMVSENELLNKLEWHEKSYSVQVDGGGEPVNQGLLYGRPEWHFS
jgi:lipopolysaccharide transport system ATP-binding protein